MHSLRFALLTVAVFLAITVMAGTASASCENGIEARSRYFSLVYFDTKPDPIGPTYERKITLMWDRMALAVATAARFQRQIQKDRKLRESLFRMPVAFQMSPDGFIKVLPPTENVTQAPRDALEGRDLVLLMIVAKAKPQQAPEVSLYSVELGRSLRRSDKEALLRKLRGLAMRRIEKGWQPTLGLDWIHRDCNVGDWDRPTLFVVSRGAAGRTTYSVMSGLYADRRDAMQAARRISAEFHLRGKVEPIHLTGSLLRSVFPPV